MSIPSYPIRDLLKQPETQLGKLFAHAKAIDDLNLTFLKVIDSDLVPHCRVGSYHQGIMVLLCSSPAYATKIRYLVPSIISKLRSYTQWAGLSSIQVKVQTQIPESPADQIPDKIKHSPAEAYPLCLSEGTKLEFQELAERLRGMKGMDSLVKILERLAT